MADSTTTTTTTNRSSLTSTTKKSKPLKLISMITSHGSKLVRRRESRESERARGSTEVIREIVPDKEKGRYLKNIPLFASLGQFEREKLGGALRVVNFRIGEAVFLQGEPGDNFFIIKEGTAQISQIDSITKKVVPFDTLSAGDYFGELSILTGSERSASIHAHTDLTCFVLDKIHFLALFKKDRLAVEFANRRRIAVSAGKADFTLEKDDGIKSADKLQNAKMTEKENMVILKAINKSLLFDGLENEEKKRVAQVLFEKKCSRGEELIREGEDGDAFYIIMEGQFEILQKTKDGKQKKRDETGAGESIGDLALCYNAPRNATCRAITDATVRVLRRNDFNQLMREIGQARMDANIMWLSKINILSPLKNRERRKVADALISESYEEDEIVINEGDEGHSLYIIVRGEVVITQKDKGEIRRLKSGDVFGERALYTDELRTATVTTVRRTHFLTLNKKAFELLLGPLEHIMKNRVASYDVPKVKAKKTILKPPPFQELEVVGTLGRGAYGFVELVEHKKTGNVFALKAISKQRIVETHQKEHTLNEKSIMCLLDHPFLIQLHGTYNHKNLLYFLMEPSLGGEMFPILRNYKVLGNKHSRFYAAQMVLIYEYMHSHDVIYRDLKPENLLLDDKGYLKLTDFGFAKIVKGRTWTMCGTPEYLAPEVISSKGHGKAVDWWTLGIFIFEMLAGYTPFKGHDGTMVMFARICRGSYRFPSHINKDARTLIQGLLQHYPHRRLGNIKGGATLIKNYAWFNSFDWQGLLWGKLRAPFKVAIKNNRDTSHYNQKLQKHVIKPYVDDESGWDKDF